LLDIYIDLMRQADRTQQLLLDTDWKGATEDESAHALALELAEREKRRKQEEAQQAARMAALQKKEAEAARLEAEQAEAARLEAEQAEQRRTAASSGRGLEAGGRRRLRVECLARTPQEGGYQARHRPLPLEVHPLQAQGAAQVLADSIISMLPSVARDMALRSEKKHRCNNKCNVVAKRVR
jgi:hypothetical protein